MTAAIRALFWLLCLAVAGCANLTVTKVTSDNQASVKGQRYSLPKPMIQAVPQADGSIAVDVVYVPDSSNTYAVQTSSYLSSYSFQTAPDQMGSLNAVEFKESTSAVGQQAAASAGAALGQYLTIKASQQVAAQTAVNTAQASVDAAQSALDAATAQQAADQKNGVTANLNTDAAAVAQAQAKLQDAQQVLARTRSTAQAVAYTAAAGTPITTTTPTPGTTGFGPQTWTAPTVYELPEAHGGVLYAIVEGTTDGKPFVKLVAVNIDGSTQQDFNTAMTALGPPTLGPQNAAFVATGGDAVFTFTRPIAALGAVALLNADKTAVPNAPQASAPDSLHVDLPVKSLKPGSYLLQVSYTYDTDKQGFGTVTFSVK